MTGTRIALSDIIALPAFERLSDGMKGLGVLARRELTARAGGNAWRDFRVPHGTTSGAFKEPQFFGAIMTPKGAKADDSDFVIWCGVLASKAYEIAPHLSGIPELSVGFGAWTEHPIDYQKCITLVSILKEVLTSSAPNMEWIVEWKPRGWDANKGMLVVQARLSLIELHRQSGDDDWDDQARSFFSTACQALFALPESNWAEIEKCTADGEDETGTAEEDSA